MKHWAIGHSDFNNWMGVSYKKLPNNVGEKKKFFIKRGEKFKI
jgi:hypothetical protein